MSSIRKYILEMSYQDAIDTILEIDPSFPSKNINKSTIKKFRRIYAKKYHPDRGYGGDTLKSINAALDVLSAGKPPSYDYFATRYNQDRKETVKPYTGENVWSWAGWSGGIPNSDTIYRQGPKDMNWIKQEAWKISGKKKNPSKKDEYTFWTFKGGPGGNNVLSVFAKDDYKIIAKIAEWVTEWGGKSGVQAVLVTGPDKSNEVTVIPMKNGRADKLKAWGEIWHNSFNQNPYNDKNFVNEVRDFLDKKDKLLK